MPLISMLRVIEAVVLTDPYPFLDPENGGDGVGALYVVASLIGCLAATWAVAFVGSALRVRRAD